MKNKKTKIDYPGGLDVVGALRRLKPDAPEYGKQYALTGKTGDKCIVNGNTWKDSEVKPVKKQDLSGELKPYRFGTKN